MYLCPTLFFLFPRADITQASIAVSTSELHSVVHLLQSVVLEWTVYVTDMVILTRFCCERRRRGVMTADGLRRRPTIARRAPQPNVMERRGGGNELMNSMMRELQGAIDVLRRVGWKDLQPWGEFFAHFKAPREWTLKVMDERVTTNVLHFRGNYATITCGALLVSIITSPSVLLALSFCLALWVYLFPSGEGNDRVVCIGERELEKPERVALAVIGILCIVGLSGALYRILFYGGVGFLLCLVHAVFRPRSMKSKATRLSEEVKSTGVPLVDGLIDRAMGRLTTPSEEVK
ncbi:unnamed protein product [Choristocarpus tenellus]